MPKTIKVCDAIMGSGKTEGCMSYIKEHPEQKFLYITPYLPQVDRIIAGCPSAHFHQPSDQLPDFNFSKSNHCAYLLKEGFNVASTHQLFRQYSKEMLRYVKDNHYTLIIDEAVTTFVDAELQKSDIDVIRRGEYIKKTGVGFELVYDEYEDGKLADIFSMLRHNQLVEFPYKKKLCYYYWVMPRDLLEAFDDVIILTYMFTCQDICYYLQMIGMEWIYIGVEKTEGGQFRLTDGAGYIPEYVHHLKDMIHICDKRLLNDVGKDKTALSENWIKRTKDNSDAARNALYCYFNNYNRGIAKERRMWGTYKKMKGRLKGKGYTGAYVVFNAKASNEYRDRDLLAYFSNVYMSPDKRNWLVSQGVDVQEDRWALSEMIQWIWRSAIRDGKEIWIYIPSLRMRTLLENWIEEVSGSSLAA